MLTLVLLSTVILIVLVQWLQLIYDSKKHNIRGPFPLPIVGNGHLLLVSPQEYFNQLSRLTRKYNNVVRLYMMNKRYAVLVHPKYIEPIMKNPKGKVYELVKPWLGNGLITASGVRWQKHRKFLTPAFHFSILQTFMPVFSRNARILVEKLSKVADGRDVDVYPLLGLFALDSVSETITGVPIHAQREYESEYVKAVDVLIRVITVRMRNVFLINDFFFNITSQKSVWDKAVDTTKVHIHKILDARIKELDARNITKLDNQNEFGTKNKTSFLDLMLLGEIDGEKIPLEHIREECDTFLFAGHDTTTSSVSFALYSISRHPEIQKKLVAEQQAIFGDDLNREPTYNDIQAMKYLDLVVKETLRLYPAAPIIEKRTVEDIEVADITLPKDTNLLISIFHVHRNPEVHEEPLEFRPERHDVGNNMKPYDFIPFSSGPRNCIGQKYALLEIKLALSYVMRHFTILPSDVEVIVEPTAVLKSVNGVHVRFKPRH